MTYDTQIAVEGLDVHYASLFEALPGSFILLKNNPPHYTIIAATPSYFLETSTTKESITGKGVFEAFPGNPDDSTDTGINDLKVSLEKVVRDKQIHHLPLQRYDVVTDDGCFSEKYWRISNKPVLTEKGEVAYIVNSAEDITKEVKAAAREKEILGLEESEQDLRSMVLQAPIGICVMDAATLVSQIANDSFLEIAGRPLDEVVGWMYWDTFAEARPYYEEALNRVVREGITFRASEVEVPLLRYGKKETVHVTFVYEPMKDSHGVVKKVVVWVLDNTLQVVARRKVEESEARFKGLADQSPMVVYMVEPDAEARMSYFNKTWLDYTGQSYEEALGRAWDGIVHPEDVLGVFDAYLPAFQNKEPYTLPAVRLKRYDGEYRWHLFKGTPRYLPTGEFMGYIGVGIDIHEQKIAIEALKESEAKYRTLFESMDQGFCVLDMIFDEEGKPVDYRFLEANPVFENQTGLRKVIGKRVKELVPDLESRWFELYGTVALSGEAAHFVEGSEAMGRWFDVYAFPIGDAQSRKVAVLFSDISEQKKAEIALRQSEANLRNMILQAPVAIAILRGPSFVVELANSRMYELWGRKKEDLLNKPLFEGLPEVKDQGYEELLTGVYTTGKSFSALGIPVTLPRNEAIETVYINLLYEAFRDGDGTISGIMAVATDVTQQVLARQKIEEVVAERTKELAKSNEELKRSNQNLEEFAHAASHDLKEPVRKIHFFTHQLKDQLALHLKENELRSFQRIENASQRMGNLIDDLLLYSHVSQRPHETESIDLTQLIQSVLEDLELDIEEKRAVIHIEKLPIVKGFGRQLQQLFQNLLSNALKYSKHNVPPIVEISGKEVIGNGTEFQVIQVKDNGIGFDQEYGEKIFQMFTRLHGKNEYSGTGVGLSIVKKVVENHNGFIKTESAPDKGSTFKVYLPL